MTKNITRMDIDDAEHYTPEQRQAIIDSYPEHEREARTKGMPSLGSGRVFPIAEEAILCDPLADPRTLVSDNRPRLRMGSSIRRDTLRLGQRQ